MPRPEQRCPFCGAVEAIRIVYGFPVPELVAGSLEGELELGGCGITDGLPLWRCKRCHRAFGHLRLSDPPAGARPDT